jgi:tyrosine-protein phosphatase YwqE
MFGFFKRKKAPAQDYGPPPADFSFLGVDFHSHLVPGVDDGAKETADSCTYIQGFEQLGFRAIITTPHIHGDFYRNTSEVLRSGMEPVQEALRTMNCRLPVQVAAEYYLDTYFLTEVLPKGLLTFGANQVLVEVSMAGWPRNFDQILFAVQAAGYQPVLAHPERYAYVEDVDFFRKLKDRGIALQMNLLAPTGYYGPHIRQLALQLLDARLYDYAASDLHHERHLENLKRMLTDQQGLMARLAAYGFKNNTLLVPES